jgi:hypothetical protein
MGWHIKFINKVTATTSLKVGAGLTPCTKRVQHVIHNSNLEPGFHGRIIFVDTPAFPNPDPKKLCTPQEEIRRIEEEIGEWLKERCVQRSGFVSVSSQNLPFVVLAANASKLTVYSTCITSINPA